MAKALFRHRGFPRKPQAFFLVFLLCLQGTGVQIYAAPDHGKVIKNNRLSPANNKLSPPILHGIRLYPNDPLKIDFIIYSNQKQFKEAAREKESKEFIGYFLAALAISEKNYRLILSPQDTQLMSSPNDPLAYLAQSYLQEHIKDTPDFIRTFFQSKLWDKVYGTIGNFLAIPGLAQDNLGRFQIIPRDVELFQDNGGALLKHFKFKIMPKAGYFAMYKNKQSGAKDCSGDGLLRADNRPALPAYSDGTGPPSSHVLPANPLSNSNGLKPGKTRTLNKRVSPLVNKTILSLLEKDINEGRRFKQLRKVYSAIILATWFKHALRARINALNPAILPDDPYIKEKIYQNYLDAYKKVFYNFIKKENGPRLQKSEYRNRFYWTIPVNMVYKIPANVPLDEYIGDLPSSGGSLSLDEQQTLSDQTYVVTARVTGLYTPKPAKTTIDGLPVYFTGSADRKNNAFRIALVQMKHGSLEENTERMVRISKKLMAFKNNSPDLLLFPEEAHIDGGGYPLFIKAQKKRMALMQKISQKTSMAIGFSGHGPEGIIFYHIAMPEGKDAMVKFSKSYGRVKEKRAFTIKKSSRKYKLGLFICVESYNTVFSPGVISPETFESVSGAQTIVIPAMAYGDKPYNFAKAVFERFHKPVILVNMLPSDADGNEAGYSLLVSSRGETVFLPKEESVLVSDTNDRYNLDNLLFSEKFPADFSLNILRIKDNIDTTFLSAYDK